MSLFTHGPYPTCTQITSPPRPFVLHWHVATDTHRPPNLPTGTALPVNLGVPHAATPATSSSTATGAVAVKVMKKGKPKLMPKEKGEVSVCFYSGPVAHAHPTIYNRQPLHIS